MVSLTAFKRNGSCNCPRFERKIAPFLRRGETPEVDPRCKHIVAAAHYWMRVLYRWQLDEWIRMDGPDQDPGPEQGQNQY